MGNNLVGNNLVGNHLVGNKPTTNLVLEPSVVSGTNGIKPSNLILELTDPFSDKGLEEDDDVDSVILPTKVVIAPEGARYDIGSYSDTYES